MWGDGTKPGPVSCLQKDREFRCWNSNEGRNWTRLQVCMPEGQGFTWVTWYGGCPFHLLMSHTNCFRDGHDPNLCQRGLPWHSPPPWPKLVQTDMTLRKSVGWLAKGIPLSLPRLEGRDLETTSIQHGETYLSIRINKPWTKLILRLMVTLDFHIT